MYSYKRDSITLTTDSRKDFLYATKDYAKLEKGRKDEEAKVCALIVSSFSEEAKMQLRTNTAYIQAANDNNSFQMYTLAKAAHTRATSFAVAQHSFLQLLSLKMREQRQTSLTADLGTKWIKVPKQVLPT